jgi:hypothetical protein
MIGKVDYFRVVEMAEEKSSRKVSLGAFSSVPS